MSSYRYSDIDGGSDYSDSRYSEWSPSQVEYTSVNPSPRKRRSRGRSVQPTFPNDRIPKPSPYINNHNNDSEDGSQVFPLVASSPASAVGIWSICMAIIVGAGIGALLSSLQVDDAVAHWIKLPGELYIQALQCLVIPLVFVSVTMSVAELVHLKQGKPIMFRMMQLIVMFNIISVVEGIGMGFLSRLFFEWGASHTNKIKTNLVFSIQCSNQLYLQEDGDTVKCSGKTQEKTSQFIVNDVNHAFIQSPSLLASGSTLSNSFSRLLQSMVPSNSMNVFIDNTLLCFVAFAIPCGITLAKCFQDTSRVYPLYYFLREVHETLVMMMQYIIMLTPIAVLSLLSGSFGYHLKTFMVISPTTLILYVCFLLALTIFVHMIIILPLIAMAFTRGKNPYSLMGQVIPGYIFSIGCASSAAALPVITHCLELSGTVSLSMMHVVVSTGTSFHKNGTSIYLPMMVFMLADITGLRNNLGGLQIVVLILASFIGSFAAAPIPGGSLAMFLTVWQLTFSNVNVDIVSIFPILLAADIVLDRLVTVCNVHGDIMMCYIINEQFPEEDQSAR